MEIEEKSSGRLDGFVAGAWAMVNALAIHCRLGRVACSTLDACVTSNFEQTRGGMVTDESDFQLQNSAQAIEFAREAIRSGILINGGAAVAVLSLLSGENTASRFDVNASGGRLRHSQVAFSPPS